MANRQTHTILVVDDSPENLDLIRNILEPSYQVKVSISGALALDIAKTQKPDLILLDIVLDEMDGYEICEMLKADPSTQHIPVIFLTSKSDETAEIRGFKLGACDYITKPFSPPIMLARIKTHIRLKTKTDLLEKLASLDPLTEIPNRRAFDTALERQWRQGKRTGMPLSLALVDIDHFKQFNDHYGHTQGDECLKQVANALIQNTKRQEDLVARFGGEEFVILLPNTDAVGALFRAEQYREAIEQLNIAHAVSSPRVIVTISIGVAAILPSSEFEPARLIQAADDALYHAKRQGKNQVCLGNL